MNAIGASSDAWSLPIVSNILHKLISKSQNATGPPASSAADIHILMGYFGRIELARMECLLSDYVASLSAISSINLNDPNELFVSVPVSHVNVFYHAAVSMIMIRRYDDAIGALSSAILHISRVLKPGSVTLKSSVLTQHQKMMEKMLMLYALASTMSPGHRSDEQVVDAVLSKCSDKLKRLQAGDVGTFEDIFESACPKFISPMVSENTTQSGGFDAWRTQVHVFMMEAKQQIALMKLRSYLRLYSCIELGKLSRFNDMSEEELVSKLLALSHKCRDSTGAKVSYSISDGKLIINSDQTPTLASVPERYFFISGIRKSSEHVADLNDIFRDFESK